MRASARVRLRALEPDRRIAAAVRVAARGNAIGRTVAMQSVQSVRPMPRLARAGGEVRPDKMRPDTQRATPRATRHAAGCDAFGSHARGPARREGSARAQTKNAPDGAFFHRRRARRCVTAAPCR
ncbi:hypothetical protein [Burkholderia thailandensis]|uniref:hypothetical protein n=1 Tax=Burkholderia thailandensis TaxID=57975 RepID=UPI00046D3031|nr:hypothetical protein [Burkholderia thailandensis]AOJ49954.1 hypothetical protein AQ475_03305 [Burkholderia thailandensis]AVR25350.1 hypothetical protein A8H32_09730 [Burkholderia thailandensis]MCZ2892938.1 hypothetical protein [Burkholderia thailandensis]